MHELSVAQNILDIVSDTAHQNNVSKITGIELEIGKFSGIEIDALTFALETLMQNNQFENAELKIDLIKGRGHCNECNNDFEMESMYASCTNCKSFSVDITGGQELRVKSINVD